MTDCMICFSALGNEVEEEQVVLPFTNMLDYFGCNCSKTDPIVHKICLEGLNKCPMCRFEVHKPWEFEDYSVNTFYSDISF